MKLDFAVDHTKHRIQNSPKEF